MKRSIWVLVGVLLASGASAYVSRVILQRDLVREATVAVPFGWPGGTSNGPFIHKFCDSRSGDRVYVVASRQVVGGVEQVDVRGIAVVPRGCADWPR